MAGLPLVLAIYYQDGLGYTALQSGLGVTAYALGSAIGAPLAGRFVTRIGRPLLLVGLASFAVGAIALAVLAGYGAAALAPALFLMGAGSGAIITPNQALSLDADRPGRRQHRRRRPADRTAYRHRDRTSSHRRQRSSLPSAGAATPTHSASASSLRWLFLPSRPRSPWLTWSKPGGG